MLPQNLFARLFERWWHGIGWVGGGGDLGGDGGGKPMIITY